MGYFLVFQIMAGSHNVVLAGSETPASLGAAYLHLWIALGQMTSNGQRGSAEAEQSYASTVLPASLL